MSSDRPSIDEAIGAIVSARTAEWHTCLPGVVQAFDAGSGRASVAPAVGRRGKGGKVSELPVLTGVPVLWPGGAGAEIRWELAQGDEVLLVFASADTSAWRSGTGRVEAASSRRFALSDAMCLPLRRPSSTPPAISIVLGADGTVRIGSGDTDLVAAVQRLAAAVSTAAAPPGGGTLTFADDVAGIATSLAALVSS